MAASGNTAEKIVEPDVEEPSMDDILASIRQIISDDEKQGDEVEEREDYTHPTNPSNSNAEAQDDVLQSSVIDALDREMEAAVAAELDVQLDPPEAPFSEKLDAQNEDIQQQAQEVREKLSAAGGVATGLTLEERMKQFRSRAIDNKDAALAGSAKVGGMPEEPVKPAPAIELPVYSPPVPEPGDTARALLDSKSEELGNQMEEMVRPMVREWVSDNLPALVERLVREEIERVSRSRKA